MTAGGRVRVRVIPGWRSVRVDLDRQRLTVPAGVQLDLGATVKGWAADRSRRADRGACSAAACWSAWAATPRWRGSRPRAAGGSGCRTGRRCPASRPDGPSQVVTIRDGGLATSSTAARRWRRGGDVLHHILDPRTGRPGRPGVADRLGGRRDLRRREHRGDRRDHQGPSGPPVADRPQAPRPPRRPGRHRPHRQRLARRPRLTNNAAKTPLSRIRPRSFSPHSREKATVFCWAGTLLLVEQPVEGDGGRPGLVQRAERRAGHRVVVLGERLVAELRRATPRAARTPRSCSPDRDSAQVSSQVKTGHTGPRQ